MLCKGAKNLDLVQFGWKRGDRSYPESGWPILPQISLDAKYQPRELHTYLGLFWTSFHHVIDQISWFGAELGLERPNVFLAILGQFYVKFGVSSVIQNGV